MLIGSGCGVPGVMASRTIEQDRDRKMTIMTTTFIPCGAKMPIVGLIAGALFGNSGWVSTGAYFIGVAAVIVSGIMLKKTKMVRRRPRALRHGTARLPRAGGRQCAAQHVGARLVVHQARGHGDPHLQHLHLVHFQLRLGAPAPVETATAETEAAQTEVSAEELNAAAEAAIAEAEGPVVFRRGGELRISPSSARSAARWRPCSSRLGFGNWQSTVATVMGLVAKEEVVGVFGVLYGVTDEEGEDAAMGIVEDENMSNEEKERGALPHRPELR